MSITMYLSTVYSCLIISISINLNNCLEPGPEVIATKGEVWPKPKRIFQQQSQLQISDQFVFDNVGYSCDILEKAIQRYSDTFFKSLDALINLQGYFEDEHSVKQLSGIFVNLSQPCMDTMMLSLQSNESYVLSIDENEGSVLSANSVWGILRGLETFSQLIYEQSRKLTINIATIEDEPRFPHRGLMLDTSRHFIPVSKIFRILDGMAYNKLNVFHWHIVDDQAFPYENKAFPKLSLYGAYNPSLVYSTEDVKEIVEYARLRGIRVIPEFDTPGHTRSWGLSYPNLLTKCLNVEGWNGEFGPFDPTSSDLYNFLEDFFHEVFISFSDKFLHLGGDEIDYTCWHNQKHIADFMQLHDLRNFTGLEYYYFKKLTDILYERDRNFIAWEDIFHSNGHRLKNLVYETWIGTGYKSAEKITKAGMRVIFSCQNWYLSQISTGGDWEKLYNTDPHYMQGSKKQKDLILGGETCLWSEYVDSTNVLTRIWPRASAVAEKLWSPKNADTLGNAAKRLEEHACRMNKRGVPAQPPNGPGYCL